MCVLLSFGTLAAPDTCLQKMPLYMHTVMSIVREMGHDHFKYSGELKLRNQGLFLLIQTLR